MKRPRIQVRSISLTLSVVSISAITWWGCSSKQDHTEEDDGGPAQSNPDVNLREAAPDSVAPDAGGARDTATSDSVALDTGRAPDSATIDTVTPDAGGTRDVAASDSIALDAGGAPDSARIDSLALDTGGAPDAAVSDGVALDGGTSFVPAATNIYAVNYNSVTGADNVTVYPANASGDFAPIAKISGSNTGLAAVVGVGLDAEGKIYVLGPNGQIYPAQGINVFAPGANGNIAPIATIAGSNTGLVGAQSIAVDPSGKIYVAGAVPCSNCTSSTRPGILVFAAGANGNVAPIQTIAPDAYPTPNNTGLDSGSLYVGLDSTGDICVGVSCDQDVEVFSPSASGNVAPVRTISGDKAGINCTSAVVGDAAGKLYVANYIGQNVTVYAAGAAGNVVPIATIGGSNTGIVDPTGFAVDKVGNLYVSGSASDGFRTRSALLMFSAGANGNVAPDAVIVGADTELYATSLAVH